MAGVGAKVRIRVAREQQTTPGNAVLQGICINIITVATVIVECCLIEPTPRPHPLIDIK